MVKSYLGCNEVSYVHNSVKPIRLPISELTSDVNIEGFLQGIINAARRKNESLGRLEGKVLHLGEDGTKALMAVIDEEGYSITDLTESKNGTVYAKLSMRNGTPLTREEVEDRLRTRASELDIERRRDHEAITRDGLIGDDDTLAFVFASAMHSHYVPPENSAHSNSEQPDLE